MSQKRKVIVIGAGPAGLTAAYELSKDSNLKVIVYEEAGELGGMCKSLTLWDCIVDLGPHRFFSNDTRVNKLWLEVVKNNYQMVLRQTRILYKKKLFSYPIAPFNALKNLGIFTAIECVFSYFQEKLFPTKPDGSFESWVTSRFGKKLYSIFFKDYSEKLWGINCKDLDADFASQRIKKFSFMSVLVGFFKNNKKCHKTLVDEFAYPISGTGNVYETMGDEIKKRGGEICLNQKVKGVVLNADKTVQGVLLNDGQTVDAADIVISTMPLTNLLKGLAGIPEEVQKSNANLKYRSTILVYLKIAGKDLFTDNWLYIQEPELQMGRVTNFRNWTTSLYKGHDFTILALEYWCNTGDAFWDLEDQEYINLAKQEILTTPLLKGSEVLDGYVFKIPKSYPVYSKGYKSYLVQVENYLKTIPNLYCIGRNGSFKYNNQDHSILMGWMCAQNIAEGKDYNLWEINTDYDSYQESSLITETGLVSKKGF